MIVNFIIDAITTLLGAAFSILPTGTLSFFDSVYANTKSISYYAAPWEPFAPMIGITATLTLWLSIVLPAVLGYKVANWLYTHIPTIAGFGPGAG